MLSKIDDHANSIAPPPIAAMPVLAPAEANPDRHGRPLLVAAAGLGVLAIGALGLGGFVMWTQAQAGAGAQALAAKAKPELSLTTQKDDHSRESTPAPTTPSPTPVLAIGQVNHDPALARALTAVLDQGQPQPSLAHQMPFGDRPGISPDDRTPRLLAAAAQRLQAAVEPAQHAAEVLTSSGGFAPARLNTREALAQRLALTDSYLQASEQALTTLSGMARWARVEARASGISSEQTELVATRLARSIDAARLVQLRGADAAAIAAERRALTELQAAWPDWQATASGVRFRDPAAQRRYEAALADTQRLRERVRAIQATAVQPTAARTDETVSSVSQ